MGAFEQGGRVAIDVAEHKFIDEHIGRIVDDVVVGFPRHVLLAKDVSGLGTPGTGMEQRLAVLSADLDLHPRAAGRIARGELVSRLVDQKQIDPGQAIVQDELGLEVEGLLFEHGQGAVDGAVELGF